MNWVMKEMNEYQLKYLICESFPDAPDLWGRIKLEIARTIAEELIASLDTITNPNGKEIRDKKDELVYLIDKMMKKGA
jgi:hypothetical protein